MDREKETFFNFLKGFIEGFLVLPPEKNPTIMKKSFSSKRKGDYDSAQSRHHPCGCVLKRLSFTSTTHLPLSLSITTIGVLFNPRGGRPKDK
jgi:hypothetical protein